MAEPLTLVIDQGTYSSRALAFDEKGQVQAAKFCQVALHRHSAAEIEQDAEEIAASVQQVVEEALAEPAVRRAGVKQVGLTTQRSSVVAWDRRSGEPLAPLLSWQDRRVADRLQPLAPQATEIKRRTGLRLTPHYGGGKLRWYLDEVPAVKQAYQKGTLAFGPLASFLIFRLLKGQPRRVDHVNASRTQLWNLESREWDPWLLEQFGVPIEPLPACCPTNYSYGRLAAADIPLAAVNGDQNAAIYSLGRPEPGTAIVNIGTGAFILALTGPQPIPHPDLLTGLASSAAAEAEYLLEGTVNGAAAALKWAEERWTMSNISRKLAVWLEEVTEPPLFINTIGGLGAPWWRSGPQPRLVGPAAEPAEKAVAVAESILFLLQANLEAMIEAGVEIKQIQISGGLARLDGLCQRLANLSQRPVQRPVETEATARGMAWLAAGRPESWPPPGPADKFQPQAQPALQQRYAQFLELIRDSTAKS